MAVAFNSQTNTKGEASSFTFSHTPAGANRILIVDVALRNSMEYAHWRMEVYHRDKFTCQQCGDNSGRNLQAHHVFGFTTYPKYRFVLENGITLCEKCHKDLHYKQLVS